MTLNDFDFLARQALPLVQGARHVALIVTDSSGQVMRINEGAEVLLGMAAEDAVGKRSITDLFTPIETMSAAARRARRNKGSALKLAQLTAGVLDKGRSRVLWRCDEGATYRIMEAEITALRDDEGALEGFLALIGQTSQGATPTAHAAPPVSLPPRGPQALDEHLGRATLGYLRVEMNGRVARINDVLLGWLGLPRETVEGVTSLSDLLSPRARDAARRGEFNAKSAGEPALQVMEFLGGKGRPLQLMVASNEVRGHDGRIQGAWYSVLNPLDAKNVLSPQEQEASLQRRAQALVNLGYYEVFFSPAADQREVILTSGTWRILGLEADSVRMTNDFYYTLIHPADRQRVRELFLDVLATRERNFNCDYRLMRVDGDEVYVRDVAQVQYDHDGRPVSSLGIVQDITARSTIERISRRVDRRAAAAIERLPLGIVLHDADLRITAWNQRMRVLTGTPSSTVLGRHLDTLLPEGTLSQWPTPWGNVQAGASTTWPDLLRLERGSLRWSTDDERTPNGVWLRVSFTALGTDPEDQLGGLISFEEVPGGPDVSISDSTYRRFVELSREAMWINRDEKIVFINRAALELLGEDSPEAVLGRSPLDFFHADDKDMVLARIRATRSGVEMSTPALERIVRPGGRVREVEVTRGRLGPPDQAAILVLLRDVTDSVRIENALAQSELRYRNLLELCPDPIWVIQQGRIVFANTLCKQLLRADTDEDLLGRPVLQFVHPEYHLLVRERIRHAEATGEIQPLQQEKLICLDGQVRDVEVASVSMRDGQGSTLIAVMHDITERVRSQATLREAMALHQQILAGVNEGIVVFDTDLRIVSWNRYMETITGLREHEVIGKRIYDYSDSARLYRPHEYMLKALGGEATTYPEPFGRIRGTSNFLPPDVRADGVSDPRAMWTQCAWTPLRSAEGEIRGVISTITDVTDSTRNRARAASLVEELRHLGAHMEGVREDERMRIAREMHDDLANQLAVVRVSLQQALALQERGSEQLHHGIEGIERAIAATRRIIRDLRPPVLDQMGIWSAIDWLVKDSAERHGLRWTVDIPDAIRAIALANGRATAIFRTVQEALSNIIKHANARVVTVSAATLGQELVLDVKDDGKGVAAGQLETAEHWGLMGMRERALALGGRTDLSANLEGGLCLRLILPL